MRSSLRTPPWSVGGTRKVRLPSGERTPCGGTVRSCYRMRPAAQQPRRHRSELLGVDFGRIDAFRWREQLIETLERRPQWWVVVCIVVHLSLGVGERECVRGTLVRHGTDFFFGLTPVPKM